VAAALVFAGAALAAARVNVHKLPLGDGHVSTTSAKRGWIYSCGSPPGGGGAQANGPWIHGTTFDLMAKVAVPGAVKWPQAHVKITRVGTRVRVSGDGLPVGSTTGTFPIPASSEAYKYDRNPNTISEQTISWLLPAPKAAARPACIRGIVGIAVNGVPIFDGVDALNRDAVAHEVQDRCDGHPEMTGQYHYHSISACLPKSGLVGYALDGYPIYSGGGYTDSDLDACHGRSVNGHYRYQATLEFPYTVGCFHGTPLRLAQP
jgi:hypothetical protein